MERHRGPPDRRARHAPDLPETVWHHCLCRDLQHANLEFQREVPLAIVYEDIRLNQGSFADIIVAQTVLLELRSAGRILPVREARTRTWCLASPIPR